MAFSSIVPWQIYGEEVESVTDFIFLGSKVTADSDHSHEIKDAAPWKKNYDKLGGVLRSRDVTLPTKVYIVKTMAFPVVIYGCQHWTIKKAEHQQIDAFELWC